jgi:hypothetical protein
LATHPAATVEAFEVNTNVNAPLRVEAVIAGGKVVPE